MTAIRFAGGRLYAWICVIEFQSLVRDNFDRVGTYKKVFGSFGLMDVKRGGRKHPELPNVSGQRNAGVPVETPEVTTGFPSALDAGGTLRVASRILVAARGAVQRARQAELAGLTVANVKTEPETQTPLLFITKRTFSLG